jgi:hypothetical protein
VLRRGLAQGDRAGGVGAGSGRGGRGILQRSRDPEPEASWPFFVLQLKGQRSVMASTREKMTVAAVDRCVVSVRQGLP